MLLILSSIGIIPKNLHKTIKILELRKLTYISLPENGGIGHVQVCTVTPNEFDALLR